MIRLQEHRILVTGVLATLLIGVAGILVLNKLGTTEHETMGKLQLTEVPDNDVPALEHWAKLMCQGQTVEQFASAHGVEASLDAVVADIARGLPSRSRDLVEEVCKKEFRRNSNL
jgi:hypothetical protein